MKTDQLLSSVFPIVYSWLAVRRSSLTNLFHLRLLILFLLALAGSAYGTDRSAEVIQTSPAPGRTQRLANPDAVPDGLSSSDWSSIRQLYEQHRHREIGRA